jgi:hypothetical protein
VKAFKNKITLVKNSRGCYILDTVKGCSICRKEKPNGCYDNCYAKNIAFRYGFDFINPVKRDFTRDNQQLRLFDFQDNKHINDILNKISNIDMPFIRIGEMGDPSEYWVHTIEICKIIKEAGREIVIITKHWKEISDELLADIAKLGLYINTSISALDNDYEIEYRLGQFNRLKNFCHSILRIVSCDFNTDNKEGSIREKIQKKILNNYPVIDTIFRPSKDNPLVIKNIINTRNVRFLKSNVLASVYNDNPYLGFCSDCPDMCGLTVREAI